MAEPILWVLLLIKQVAHAGVRQIVPDITPNSEILQRAKIPGAWLIRKVYEIDALECSGCKGPLWKVVLSDDRDVVRQIH